MIDETERDIADAAARIDRIRQDLAVISRRQGPVTGRARSGDGSIEVIVDAAGVPVEVRISPRAMKDAPESLAASIVDVATRAARDAATGHRGRLDHLGVSSAPSDLGGDPRTRRDQR